MYDRANAVRHTLLPLCAALAVALGACHSDSSNMAPAVAITIVANAGSDGQTGVAGQPLPQLISVHVNDQDGNAVVGATVTWAVTAGGGSVFSPTSTTDVSGNATIVWTLGATIGANTLTATLASGASVTLRATGTSGSISRMVKVSGDAQAIAAGSTSAPLMVQVTDSFGNVEPGQTVTWTVVNANGGALTATTSTTDSNGLALTTFMTGPIPAAYSITATAGGFLSVTFVMQGV